MNDLGTLADALGGHESERSDLIYSVVIGVVTNNMDEENLGRVKLKLPTVSEADESAWARLAVPMAGPERGTYFLPEVGDEVLVAFEQGDINFPYVVGSLWNGMDKPPERNKQGKNDIRSITSRSGHVIRLDDSRDEEKIEIIHAKKEVFISIDRDKVAIGDEEGDNAVIINVSDKSVTVCAAGDISIEAVGKLKLSGQGVEIGSQAGVKVEASQNLDLKAGAQTNVKGATINLN